MQEGGSQDKLGTLRKVAKDGLAWFQGHRVWGFRVHILQLPCPLGSLSPHTAKSRHETRGLELQSDVWGPAALTLRTPNLCVGSRRIL